MDFVPEVCIGLIMQEGNCRGKATSYADLVILVSSLTTLFQGG